MRLTAELRWFWQGNPPAAFKGWFLGHGPSWAALGDSESRTDRYLRDKDQPALGIKKRGGAEGIEIKGLVSRCETILQVAGMSGPVELWTKWSSHSLDVSGAPLVSIKKQRWMRKFEINSGAVAEKSDPHRSSGCDAELTLLEDNATLPWWTFGFEAFGSLEQVERYLAATVAVFAERGPPPLAGGEPNSYPGWLASLRD